MCSKGIVSIDTALKIYYSMPEIGNKEIRELFGPMSSKTMVSLKREALEEMTVRGVKGFRNYTVNTEVAYAVWGIDVEDLEKRRKKLQALGLHDRG